MDVVLDGLAQALSLLVHLDPEVLGITALSLEISVTATLLSLVVGITAGVAVALSRFPGKRLVVSLVNTGMGLPPVGSACSCRSCSGGAARSAASASSTLPPPSSSPRR